MFSRDVLALFDDDPQAQDILEGTMEDMTMEELRELTGLSQTAYDSKRRLIRRRIDRAYGSTEPIRGDGRPSPCKAMFAGMRHVRTVRVKIDRVDRIGLREARTRAKAIMSQIQSGGRRDLRRSSARRHQARTRRSRHRPPHRAEERASAGSPSG